MDDDTRRERIRQQQREAQARYAARKRGEDIPLRTSGPSGTPLRERIEASIVRTESGCWEWTRSLDGNGYPRIMITEGGQRRTRGVHRITYEIYVGPIPAGLVIDHLCRNPKCVNPDHLEAVTQTVNFLRGMHRTAVTIREGRCQRGHEMTPENTIKVCKTCVKNNADARREGVYLRPR